MEDSSNYTQSERNAVRIGALLMDSGKPEWWKLVNVDTLSMHNSECCVCTQSGLLWETLSNKHDEMVGEERGHAAFAALTVLWREEIEARRLVHGWKPEPVVTTEQFSLAEVFSDAADYRTNSSIYLDETSILIVSSDGSAVIEDKTEDGRAVNLTALKAVLDSATAFQIRSLDRELRS